MDVSTIVGCEDLSKKKVFIGTKDVNIFSELSSYCDYVKCIDKSRSVSANMADIRKCDNYLVVKHPSTDIDIVYCDAYAAGYSDASKLTIMEYEQFLEHLKYQSENGLTEVIKIRQRDFENKKIYIISDIPEVSTALKAVGYNVIGETPTEADEGKRWIRQADVVVFVVNNMTTLYSSLHGYVIGCVEAGKQKLLYKHGIVELLSVTKPSFLGDNCIHFDAGMSYVNIEEFLRHVISAES